MKIAHIGPPRARQGGPAGYLLQLGEAARRAGAEDRLLLPPLAVRRGAQRPSPLARVRRGLRHVKRMIAPAPRFYRPSDEVLRADRGHIEGMIAVANAEVVAQARVSFGRAFAESADVLFCHEPAAAEHALNRRTGQQVWLMLHSPIPLALYLVWNWGVPERDWQDVMTFPDVQRWTAWEVALWHSVDRLIIPCRGAFAEIARVTPSALPLEPALTYVLSGASAMNTSPVADRDSTRRRFGLPLDVPVGLFLGNQQPYRGLDTLLSAAATLGSDAPAGVIVVAGPQKGAIPSTARVRGLGLVADVASLLAAVDFVINVNRFSLFDLSTIEALEAGKPLLLHGVGGNIAFEQLGAGTVVIDDLQPKTIADGLSLMFAMTPDRRAALAQSSRRCYDAHLTLEKFWNRHAALYASAAPARA